MKKRTHTPKSGFSLVELAIVLVIIGLIVGGILTGQDLIKASELNAVISEHNKYSTAVNTFSLKYNGLPGDLKNATSYWTSATANGDNDGLIETVNEAFRGWQHLSLAGIIPGSYPGTHTGNTAVPGTNVPASSFTPGGWGFYHNPSPWSMSLSRKNRVFIGGQTTGDQPTNSLFTPAEAYSIDGKVDDSLAGNGTVVNGGGSCQSGGNYTLSTTTAVCSLLWDL